MWDAGVVIQQTTLPSRGSRTHSERLDGHWGKWSMAWGHSPGMRVSAPSPPHNQSRGIKPARHCVLLHDWCLSTRAAQGRKIILKDSCTFWRSKWFSHSVVDLRPVLTSKGGGAEKDLKGFLWLFCWKENHFNPVNLMKISIYDFPDSMELFSKLAQYGNCVIEFFTNNILSIAMQMTSNGIWK